MRRFLFLLARSLGRTVAELEASMSAAEFGEWMVLYGVEPWGDVRSDLAIGRVSATMTNLYLRKGDKPAVASDFAPLLKAWEEPVAEESDAEPDPIAHFNSLFPEG